MLHVNLREESSGAVLEDAAYCVIYRNVMQGEFVRVNAIVNARAARGR